MAQLDRGKLRASQQSQLQRYCRSQAVSAKTATKYSDLAHIEVRHCQSQQVLRTLRVKAGLASLVLCDLVDGVLLAVLVLAESTLGLRHVHLRAGPLPSAPPELASEHCASGNEMTFSKSRTIVTA